MGTKESNVGVTLGEEGGNRGTPGRFIQWKLGLAPGVWTTWPDADSQV